MLMLAWVGPGELRANEIASQGGQFRFRNFFSLQANSKQGSRACVMYHSITNS